MPPEASITLAASTDAVAAGSMRRIRLRGLLVALACGAALAAAWSLAPRASGYGTHREMGLPMCSFLSRTGYPCPTCGMTTATAAAVRGRLREALVAHPFGVTLAAFLHAFAAMGLFELVAARPVLSRLRPRWWWALAGLAGVLAGWGGKVLVGLARGTLPI